MSRIVITFPTAVVSVDETDMMPILSILKGSCFLVRENKYAVSSDLIPSKDTQITIELNRPHIIEAAVTPLETLPAST